MAPFQSSAWLPDVSASARQQVLFAGATDFHRRLNDVGRLTGSAVRR
jgi:hypothetical protein